MPAHAGIHDFLAPQKAILNGSGHARTSSMFRYYLDPAPAEHGIKPPLPLQFPF
jgi:hypothetical protein